MSGSVAGKNGLRSSRLGANGATLYLVEAGAADAPLVFLLHGFPEFWFAWRHQIAPVAAAGFHVIAPDLRGYGQSEKPPGVAAYDLDVVAGDILALAERFGRKRFSVVGHDWGASVGWWLAQRHPERIERLVALNAPHPAVWRQAMRRHPEQRRKSRYVGMFRLPALPELLLRLNDYDGLVKALRSARRQDAFSDEDIARYRAAWRQPGALTAMINWYRALLRKDMRGADAIRITVPTTLIWGVDDAYGARDLAGLSIALCDRGRVVFLDNATHWVQHDEPERVTALILEALAAPI